LSEAGYIVQRDPFKVPTGDDKTILEHFGMASVNAGEYSLARMTAPPGWEEPAQTPVFDEVTLMISGRKRVELENETVEIGPGESLLVRAGNRVRYSNPFAVPAEYVSLCIPAFTPERVNRES
jgi:mannose-6-phosphate isomerase-like protein (cupin superfamily)